MVAEGAAHIYPRLAPTSEWDTCAAQAIVECAGGEVLQHAGGKDCEPGKPVAYNKPDRDREGGGGLDLDRRLCHQVEADPLRLLDSALPQKELLDHRNLRVGHFDEEGRTGVKSIRDWHLHLEAVRRSHRQHLALVQTRRHLHLKVLLGPRTARPVAAAALSLTTITTPHAITAAGVSPVTVHGEVVTFIVNLDIDCMPQSIL